MQPYRAGQQQYAAQVVEDVRISWRDAHVAIELPEKARIWSSAVFNGGEMNGSCIVNHMVGRFFDSKDPAEYMRESCLAWGYDPANTVGLITAAKLSHLSLQERHGDEFDLLCATTAGTTNAARAGVPRAVFSSYMTMEEDGRNGNEAAAMPQKPGTINTVIVLEAQLTDAAVWNLLMVAAEAKAAALADLHIQDPETGLVATGTTTDTVVIAVLNRGTYHRKHLYGGTATTIGSAVGQLVYETVYESVQTQKEK